MQDASARRGGRDTQKWEEGRLTQKWEERVHQKFDEGRGGGGVTPKWEQDVPKMGEGRGYPQNDENKKTQFLKMGLPIMENLSG